MDAQNLSRSAIEKVRMLQAALVAAAAAVPAVASYQDDISTVGDNIVAIITAVSALLAIVLQYGVVRPNVTPVSDPKLDDGTPLTPPGR